MFIFSYSDGNSQVLHKHLFTYHLKKYLLFYSAREILENNHQLNNQVAYKKYNSLPASQASIFLIGAQIFLSKQELSRKLHAEILSTYT